MCFINILPLNKTNKVNWNRTALHRPLGLTEHTAIVKSHKLWERAETSEKEAVSVTGCFFCIRERVRHRGSASENTSRSEFLSQHTVDAVRRRSSELLEGARGKASRRVHGLGSKNVKMRARWMFMVLLSCGSYHVIKTLDACKGTV